MAIIKNKLVSGSIGPTVYKSWRGKQVLSSQPDSPKQTKATKQRAGVFGKASRVAKLIRDNMNCFMFYDPTMINRFNAPIIDVLNHCFDEKTGSFTFERDSFLRLNGFEFHLQSLLINSLFVQPVVTLENDTLTLKIPEIYIQNQLKFPADATHCTIKVAFSLYAMEKGMETYVNYQTSEISKEQEVVPATEFSVAIPKGTLGVVGLGLQYYSKSAGMTTLINNKTFEPAAICSALVNSGIFSEENLGEKANKWSHKKEHELLTNDIPARKNEPLKQQAPKSEPEPTVLETKLDIARKLKKIGLPVDDILASTGLSVEEIAKL
ncbi:hypothetical protein LPB86_00300 [Pedobacter sp. MC2016-14]|uniref:hypothetical protein n=1 Tax=Pedobacter sp. MC2016-14 TaxID=2897327 RepID=UPI001E5A1E47|nr:hypothetical protein [Pedobacter sp. MC2016-14]MCD0486650.1 hypothetical protein [Pedobacter sp. MC2016-14]